MRRFLVFLLSLLMLLSTFNSVAESQNTPTPYDGEILFRGVEWGQNISVVNSQLSNTSLALGEGYETDPLYWERFAPYHSNVHPKYDIGMYSIGYGFSKDVTVGGHEISMVFAYYYYDIQNGTIIHDPASTHFYMADYSLLYNDIEESYTDLCNKLTRLYGEGQEESDGRSYGIKSHVWYGANDTAVRLSIDYGTASGPSLYLAYYKVDSTEHLKQMDEIAREEELQKEKQNWETNMDGL